MASSLSILCQILFLIENSSVNGVIFSRIIYAIGRDVLFLICTIFVSSAYQISDLPMVGKLSKLSI